MPEPKTLPEDASENHKNAVETRDATERVVESESITLLKLHSSNNVRTHGLRKFFFLSFLMIFSASANAATPSFDCAKVMTDVEKLICSDEKINQTLIKSYKDISFFYNLWEKEAKEVADSDKKHWETLIKDAFGKTYATNDMKVDIIKDIIDKKLIEVRDSYIAYKKSFNDFSITSTGIIEYDSYEKFPFTREEQDNICSYVLLTQIPPLSLMTIDEIGIDKEAFSGAVKKSDFDGKWIIQHTDGKAFARIDYDNDGNDEIIFRNWFEDGKCTRYFYKEYDSETKQIKEIVDGVKFLGRDFALIPCINGSMDYFSHNGTFYQRNTTIQKNGILKPHIIRTTREDKIGSLCYYPLLP